MSVTFFERKGDLIGVRGVATFHGDFVGVLYGEFDVEGTVFSSSTSSSEEVMKSGVETLLFRRFTFFFGLVQRFLIFSGGEAAEDEESTGSSSMNDESYEPSMADSASSRSEIYSAVIIA